MTRHADLLASAAEAVSLSDFGDSDYLEGLELLVWSADNEARLNELGRKAFDDQVKSLLINRLQIEQWYSIHPEIDDEEVVAPLIGLGLPRTGSTVLSSLLAADPAVRSLRQWESLSPCPPPETLTEHDDPRIELARASLRHADALFPRLAVMVPTEATGPIECQQLMSYGFKSQLFHSSFSVPSYTRWLHFQADLAPAYRYVKRVLKLLQWHCPPRRWRLKNPSHSLFINALDTVFPDARYWMTHRDISLVVPSMADLYYELHKPFTNEVNLDEIGRTTVESCEIGMRRVVEFRDMGNDSRVIDVYFEDLQNTPFLAVQRLYDRLGEPLTDEARACMAQWLRDNSEDRTVIERNPPGMFGIKLQSLTEVFKFYSQRYGVDPLHEKLPSWIGQHS